MPNSEILMLLSRLTLSSLATQAFQTLLKAIARKVITEQEAAEPMVLFDICVNRFDIKASLLSLSYFLPAVKRFSYFLLLPLLP